MIIGTVIWFLIACCFVALIAYILGLFAAKAGLDPLVVKIIYLIAFLIVLYIAYVDFGHYIPH
jgi:hypothetical protein